MEKLLVRKLPMAGATSPAQNAIESVSMDFHHSQNAIESVGVDFHHSHVHTAITTTQLFSGYPPIAKVKVFIKLMSQLKDLHSSLLYIVHAKLLQVLCMVLWVR